MSYKEKNTKKHSEHSVDNSDINTKKVFSLRYLLLCIAILIFAVYSVVTLVDTYSQIRDKKNDLDSINDQISVQEIKNGEMSKLYNYSDEEFSQYVEQIAREDLGYVKDGERVFVNVAGD